MRRTPQFMGELEFLNVFTQYSSNPYRHSRFLESKFDDDIWIIKMGGITLGPIDFRVELDDGELLTSQKHQRLLEVFKCWICVHDHPNACGGRLNSAVTARHKVQRTLHLIDYLLLHCNHFQLSKHGLQSLSANDLRGIFVCLGSQNQVHESLYDWSNRLSNFLLQQSKSLPNALIQQHVATTPMLATLSGQESGLGLSDDDLVCARVWLWINGYYQRARGESGFAWMPDIARITRALYTNTLYGQQKKPLHPELFLCEGDYGLREHARVPVTTRDDLDLPTHHHVSAYLSLFRPLELLALEGLEVPVDVLAILDEPVFRDLFEVKPQGRFKSLPQDVVLGALKESVEFLLSNGDNIVNGYLDMMSMWKASGKKFSEFARSKDFYLSVSTELRELGVNCWCIRPLPDGHRSTISHIPKDQYFKRFRSNEGLYELLQVLYGAALLVLGTLSARRSGELEDLPQNCLDKSGTRLIFRNRKSAEADMRERETRPIPLIAVRAIKMLQRIASGLKDLGAISKHPLLFSAPFRMTGVPPISHERATYERLMDNLCDYIETPLDEEGRRYYIRQHQLRRFFAMLFFWGGAFGGLDTLRWFLGHTDIEHVWHYISESISGAALRNIKAHFAVEEVLNHSPDAITLADMLGEHYGTRDFSILDPEELDLYVEELLAEGAVSVEPQFIDLPNGKSYRILISVKDKIEQVHQHA